METALLEGKLLVATPVMQDSFFEKAVIYVVAHNENGAMGVVINNTIKDLKYKDIFEQLNISESGMQCHSHVRLGGPVEGEKGFVLHSHDYKISGTRVINPEFSVTSSIDVLEAIAKDKGPEKSLIMLGYAGWSAGQLESEIQEDSWMILPADDRLVFGVDDMEKWHEALRALHVDSHRYSNVVGHA
jgi:putative transcriptional regulator